MPPTYDQLVEMVEKLQNENSRLKERLEKVEKELKKYHNENTPSSSNKHLKGDTQGLHAKGGKRGAPFGHKGTTRRQQPEEVNDIDAGECPHCHSDDLENVDILKRTVEEIPIPVAPKVTENHIHKKKCRNCGRVFLPQQNTVPLEGKFGVNLMVLIIMMKLLLRGVLRKAASFLEYGFALSISPAAVNSVIQRTAKAANEEYAALKERIKNAAKVHIDETSFSILGINWWLWVFRTDNDILLIVRRSRGQDPLKEILGEDYSGRITCDCWRVYDFLKKVIIQRCWAHLLRKAKVLVTVPGRHFYGKLDEMFKEINRFNESKPTEEQHISKYNVMVSQLQELVRYYGRYDEVRPVVNYIDNHFDQWLNCVRYPDLEPTNNLAEQALRESVMYKKIIGAFRSLAGAAYHEILASLLATWQMNGLDVQTELRRVLTSNLCRC